MEVKWLLYSCGIVLALTFAGVTWLLVGRRANAAKHCPVSIYNRGVVQVGVTPGNAQHIGSREEQQDAFGFSDFNNPKLACERGILAVLADGMGGLAKGRDASTLAVRTMLNEYAAVTNPSIEGALTEALDSANKAVINLAKNMGLEGNMGTTLTAAVIYNSQLYWVSVGDSRLYLFRKKDRLQGGELTRITVDHNPANRPSGYAKGDRGRKKHNVLTSFLGLPVLKEIDRNVKPFQLQSGDCILLCSDGIHRTLSEAEIALHLDSSPQSAAEMLIQKALAKKKTNQDNMTVVILAYA